MDRCKVRVLVGSVSLASDGFEGDSWVIDLVKEVEEPERGEGNKDQNQGWKDGSDGLDVLVLQEESVGELVKKEGGYYISH